MYAKLMSRITESSLMEEPVAVRYCFMMMLAIADPEGYVIGTDVAIARRMNIPTDEFQEHLSKLMEPDPHSNSSDHEGRRVITSDGERGYYVVNYRKYRDTRDEEQRREYMKEYMRKRRAEKAVAPVNFGKLCKPQLAKAEAEAEAEADTLTPSAPRGFEEFWQAYPRRLAKGDAERAWKKMKCTAILPLILTAIRTAKASDAWTKEGGQFIPYPATWLNRKGWEDQHTIETQQTKREGREI
jgi:hypothetical protein